MADVGRPSKYSEELARDICSRLSEGVSLRSICALEEFPSMNTVWRWLDEIPEFRERYAKAKQESADALAEDIQRIADATLRNEYDPRAAKVAMDGYKWVASKLKPQKYGDKLDMTTNGKDLPTPIYAGLSQKGSKVPPKA